ncbi:heme-binding beta-barrel domain-containing protein [Psychromonas hadalis]|uniref:heme-binding beta-barrel domain-containing protein n=1 Tax=Psychromonas hadalis TaxID=211669 RepID=UPI0003B49FA4|nr:heme-binding beta-barrel domain-containing protein [Psychromonas hadalis]
MNKVDETNYGPLTKLIGSWVGKKGEDIAPEPEGTEVNSYYEKIIFTGIGETENAESQLLSVITYTQEVRRNSNDKMIHHEVGYWLWEQGSHTVVHSLTIPRGMCVLASGRFEVSPSKSVLNVSAMIEEKDWQIIQSPFMQKNAKMKSYLQQFKVTETELCYSQTMLLDIYGKEFEHTDNSVLKRV